MWWLQSYVVGELEDLNGFGRRLEGGLDAVLNREDPAILRVVAGHIDFDDADSQVKVGERLVCEQLGLVGFSLILALVEQDGVGVDSAGAGDDHNVLSGRVERGCFHRKDCDKNIAPLPSQRLNKSFYFYSDLVGSSGGMSMTKLLASSNLLMSSAEILNSALMFTVGVGSTNLSNLSMAIAVESIN